MNNQVNFVGANKAAAHPKLHSGGNTGAIRGIYAISAAGTEHPAATKCQFGGSSRASRLPFQRIKCKICDKCEICADFEYVEAYHSPKRAF